MIYYSGIYNDTKGKVLQVSNSVDGLSCEIIAEPGVRVSKDFNTVSDMLNSARTAAFVMNCHHAEINCDKGLGSYRWLRARGSVWKI